MSVDTRLSRTSPGQSVIPLDERRLLTAKKAYTTRFLDAALSVCATGYHLVQDAPKAGHVVLARITELGQHTRLESPLSRRQTLFIGDEILVAYGHRYAPDQFLAEVPDDLDGCHLVAGGGVAGRVLEQHALIGPATSIQPVGLLADQHGVITLRRLAPRLPEEHADIPARPPVIAVLGTSMNSGKSTTLACLVRGLTSAGLTVSAGKATGTGSGNDPRLFADAGAERVLDFTDFGYATTFQLDYSKIRRLVTGLVAALTTPATDVVVVEIADGVYQAETARLLADPVFQSTVDHVVFSAADALGAAGGLRLLQQAGVKVAAVSGVLTASPLAVREATDVLDVPVINTYGLCDPATALTLMPARR